jgi:hypothetical protein
MGREALEGAFLAVSGAGGAGAGSRKDLLEGQEGVLFVCNDKDTGWCHVFCVFMPLKVSCRDPGFLRKAFLTGWGGAIILPQSLGPGYFVSLISLL